MSYTKNVNFTHTVYEKGIAIAHIMHINEETQTVKYEWAVVCNPDLDPESKWYGTWGFAYTYCHTYEEAKEFFVDKVNQIRKNRDQKAVKFTTRFI